MCNCACSVACGLQVCCQSCGSLPPSPRHTTFFYLAFSPRKGECGCKGQNKKPITDRQRSWESPYPWMPQLGEGAGAKVPLPTSIINQLSHLLGVN